MAPGHDGYAPGHLGELTQVIDPQLVDAILEETGARERRLRLLPARVVVYYVLALAVFERSSYQAVWNKLIAGLHGIAVARPASSSLPRARCRLGSAPLRRLFEVLAGPRLRGHRPEPSTRGCGWSRWTAPPCASPTRTCPGAATAASRCG
ncbi:transposase domain-containing protein [Kitasatospora sp. NPDC050543]|uniref:transposase domain-containing protein n=1 Tax=Kitasatospora sp. NPDC050543 TaxID=3364054 RepID=UPI0037973806